jgi:hypothetical protein
MHYHVRERATRLVLPPQRDDVTTIDEPKENNMADTPHHAGLLSGCRVLDFTQYLAGPMVIRLMAEMGAEIIKVAIAPVLHCDL